MLRCDRAVSTHMGVLYVCKHSLLFFGRSVRRNGGHITPPLFHDYQELKKEHGEQNAQRIIRFRMAHLHELTRVAEQEGVLEHSQIRKVECLDVFYSKDNFEDQKEHLKVWKADMPEEARDTFVSEGTEMNEVSACFCGRGDTSRHRQQWQFISYVNPLTS